MAIREEIEKVRKLKEVSENLSDEDISFAMNLISNFEMYAELTCRQLEWVEILIDRAARPQASVDESEWIEASALSDLLWHAQRKGLKTPRIKLSVRGEKITVKLCKDEVIRVYGKSGLLAKINADNSIVPSKELPPSIMSALGELGLDPTHIAVSHGKETGVCCFCGLMLTTRESVFAGYGPICADKYGLPWGGVDDEDLEFDASDPEDYYER